MAKKPQTFGEKLAATGEILGEVAMRPVNAFWGLMASDAARGGPIRKQDVGNALEATGYAMAGGMLAPRPQNSVGVGMGFLRSAPEQKIKALHVSPHDFDEFKWDASVRGTGEGAQSYGDGLYFAESPKVSGLDGHYWNQFFNRLPDGPEKEAAYAMRKVGWDRAIAADFMENKLRRQTADLEREPGLRAAGWNTDGLLEALALLRSDKRLPPYGYEVDLKMRPDNLLRWDKGMPAQSKLVQRFADQMNYDIRPNPLTQEQFLQAVKDNLAEQRAKAIAQFGSRYIDSDNYDALIADPMINFNRPDNKPADWNVYMAWRDAQDQFKLARDPFTKDGVWRGDRQRTGEDFYNHLADNYDINLVQDVAKANDVYGTMFLDGNSRRGSKQKQTHNFAIWTPELVKITRKFAIPGAVGAGMIGAATDPNRETQ